MRYCLCLLVLLPFLPACASHPFYTSSFLVGESVSVSATLPYQEQEAAAEQQETEPPPAEGKQRPIIVDILLYIPNRVLDLFDIPRLGVSVGPGLGVDLTATKALNVTLMAKASVGLGFQTFRHLPVEAAAYSAVGVGPLEAVADPGLAWYRSDLDFRAELHLLLIGAHVAVEVGEIFDFLAGILFFDPEEDDL